MWLFQARLIVDGKLFVKSKHNPAIIDDWLLHPSRKVQSTKLLVGACWEGILTWFQFVWFFVYRVLEIVSSYTTCYSLMVMPVRQDSLSQDSLKHRLAYCAPSFERSCTQNRRKTHRGMSVCALASLRHEHRYVWERVVNTIYWKLFYLWKFRPIKIISGQISHIFSNLIFIH